MNQKSRESVPEKMTTCFQDIVRLTDEFCQKRLTGEYADLCRRMTAALCRKRPSPLTQGKIEIWACAIVYAIGKVNFLFDKSQKPHIRADELCFLFGVSKGSGSAKSGMILKALGISLMDSRWTLPSRMEDNPMAWMVKVNGFIIDVRRAPREIQEEAYRRGLIPYMPLERDSTGDVC